MAAGVPRPTIKRLLRWCGDLSLEIYARLNDSEWSEHVQQIYTANVDSTVAARLASLFGEIQRPKETWLSYGIHGHQWLTQCCNGALCCLSVTDSALLTSGRLSTRGGVRL